MTLEELYRLLRSGHVQTQGIVDTLQQPLVVLDKSFTVVNANPAFYRTFQTDQESTLEHSLFDLGNGQWDIPELRELIAKIAPRAAAVVGYQVEHDFPALGRRTMLVSARQLVHPYDSSTQLLVVFEDVTDRQKAEAAKDLLLSETRHRMGNLLAMVRAVARQTKPDGRTAEEYRDVFLGRFEAVLNAQEFITANDLNVDLATLVSQSMRQVEKSKAVVSPGPQVELTAYQVQPISMILHELTTNAVKYGALSSPDGTVHIAWNTELRAGRPHLLLEWLEHGGPPVSPPEKRGFGTELITHSMKTEGGISEFVFEPSGLRFKITLPLAT
jgi:two-component sensor histidine kinase